MTDPNNPPKPHEPEQCLHERIEIVGGGGDENGFYDTFQCFYCDWQFDILVDGKDEF